MVETEELMIVMYPQSC